MQGLSDLVAGRQIAGARAYQEDDYRIRGFRAGRGAVCDALMVVADGMGGHAGGKQASDLGVSTFVEAFERNPGDIKQRLRQALDAANRAIGDGARKDARYAGMGCTMLACVVVVDELHWISVGDSPLWHVGAGVIERLNADHSMRPVLESLVKAGRMTVEECARDKSGNQLRSVLMGEELALIDQNEFPRRLHPGDRMLLASDGLLSLAAEDIEAVCASHDDASAGAERLLRMVEEADLPRQDNATVVLYRHPHSGALRRRLEGLEMPTRPMRLAASGER